MPRSPLFSTYRQGENRVTSSMMAVFQRLEISLLEQLLGAATGEASLQLATFTNQPTALADSVPDARMLGRFDYWFETKRVPNVLSIEQLRHHYKNLTPDAKHERLFIVTPDPGPERPAVLAEFDHDPRVVWFNFRALSDAIDQVLGDEDHTGGDRFGYIGEHARFLLRELQTMFGDDGLLDHVDTVVVAARFAWQEYLDTGAYVCQADRSFRDGIRYMGFYAHGAIQPTIARILDQRPDPVMFDAATVAALRGGEEMDIRLADTVEQLLAAGTRLGQPYRVFVLSRTEAQGNLHLDAPIANTTKAATGRPFAWTMGQRYTRSSALLTKGVTTTTELEAAGG